MTQVQLAEAFERFWGRFGDRHLCVSRAMKDELHKNWRIEATVFYDRPPARFEPTPLEQKVRQMAHAKDIMVSMPGSVKTLQVEGRYVPHGCFFWGVHQCLLLRRCLIIILWPGIALSCT